MSEEIPCQSCGRYYGHRDNCVSWILNTGVADKIRYEEFKQRYSKELHDSQKELTKLQEDKAKLVEMGKFYANKENWLYDKESHVGGLIVVKDTWTDQPNAGAACFYPEYGGKLARQTLKDIGEEV